MSYHFHHVITDMLPSDTLKTLCKKTNVRFLHSIASNNKDILNLLGRFPNIRKEMILDSGGYSLFGDQCKLFDINEHVLMRIEQRLNPDIMIGPDFPIYGKYEWSLKLTSFRTKLFHLITKNIDLKSKYYDAIQGELKVNGEYSLKERSHWLEEITKISGNRIYGYALAGLINSSLSELAYFGMQPWSIGCKNVHILGVGSIESLALFVYMGNHCYNNFSSDAKSYTIDAGVHLNMLNPKGVNEKPGSLTLLKTNYQKYEEKDTDCNCDICKHYRKKYSTSVYGLAETNAEGDDAKIALLRAWVIGHSVCLVQNYLSELGGLVDNKTAYISYLKEKGFDDVVEAISLVDRLVLDGKDSYAGNISLLK